MNLWEHFFLPHCCLLFITSSLSGPLVHTSLTPRTSLTKITSCHLATYKGNFLVFQNNGSEPDRWRFTKMMTCWWHPRTASIYTILMCINVWYALLELHPKLYNYMLPALMIYSKYVYTWNPFVLYFGGLTLQNKVFSIQDRGHLGSRYIYIYIWCNTFLVKGSNPNLATWNNWWPHRIGFFLSLGGAPSTATWRIMGFHAMIFNSTTGVFVFFFGGGGGEWYDFVNLNPLDPLWGSSFCCQYNTQI